MAGGAGRAGDSTRGENKAQLREPKRFLFFILHTFFRGPVIFSIEKFHFVCFETVPKLQNPMFLGQLIVVELLYSTNVE